MRMCRRTVHLIRRICTCRLLYLKHRCDFGLFMHTPTLVGHVDDSSLIIMSVIGMSLNLFHLDAKNYIQNSRFSLSVSDTVVITGDVGLYFLLLEYALAPSLRHSLCNCSWDACMRGSVFHAPPPPSGDR